jgi:hypothetical protein
MRRSWLVLVLIAVVAIGLLLTRVWRPSPEAEAPRGPEAAAPAPPTSTPTAPTAVAAVQPTPPPTAPPRPTVAPTPTPASRDVVMEVTESELQSQLTSMLVGKSLGTTPLGDAMVQTVSVALRNRQVQVSGAAQAGFLNAPFTLAGTISPDTRGGLRVNVDDATVGGVALPEGTRAALADMLQTQVDGMFTDESMKVRTVDIADGKLRVVGTAGS